MTDVGPFKVGDRIAGKYEIRGLLGKGGHAFVYDAFNVIFEEEVAIKVIPNLPHRGPQLFNQAHREAKALRRMNHPNVVAVIDAGEIEGMAFIVMEKLEGMDLRKFTQLVGPLTVYEALTIASKVASALEAAHAIKVIHRDIKLENIFLGPGNNVKVLDFGIAKVLEGGYPTTQKFMVQGTVAYMSPEQAQGHGVTFASDVFQLAVIIYELITGIPPCMVGVEEPTPEVLIALQISKMPPRLKELVREVPDYVDRLVWRGLAKEPWQRYPSRDAARDREKAVFSGVMGEFTIAIENILERLRKELPQDQLVIRTVRANLNPNSVSRPPAVPDPKTTPIALAKSNVAGAPAVQTQAGAGVKANTPHGEPSARLRPSPRGAQKPDSSSQRVIVRAFARAAVIGTVVAVPTGMGLWFLRSHSHPAASEATATASQSPAASPAPAPAANGTPNPTQPVASAADVPAPAEQAIPELSSQSQSQPAPALRPAASPAPSGPKPATKSPADRATTMALPASGLDSPLDSKVLPRGGGKPSHPKPVASTTDSKKVQLIF